MRIIIVILIMLFSIKCIAQEDISVISFRDTIYYDQNSENYIIEFLGLNSRGDADSLITQIFTPPTKLEPKMFADVKFYADSSFFLYSYKIQNGSNSEQWLLMFRLYFNEDINVQNKQTNNWHGGNYKTGRHGNYISWWGDGGLAPSWATNGFAISSKYLPGIGNAGAKGATGIISYRYGFPDKKIESMLFSLSIGKKSFKLVPTIIPVKTSDSCDVKAFIDVIQSYNDSSFVFGWVETRNVRDKYDTLFKNAKSFLLNGDSSFAEYTLKKILKYCVEDSSNVLTSEAFALLYFNTEYLVNQLPEINIADMFERLIVEIEECKLSGSITNKGIYNSLKKKAENAKKSYEKDNIHSSVQKLNAFQNELRAQKDKHISIECTETLDEYSGIIIELLEE